MKYLFGITFALYGYYMANAHLEQSLGDYWDSVAFYVVLFGTISVLIITFPSDSLKALTRAFAGKFFKLSDSLFVSANRCAGVATSGQPMKTIKSFEDGLLNDGVELISLGFSRDDIEEILFQRYQNYNRKINLLVGWLKRNSKYPPAFGLSGTVLGLIHLMRGISIGIDAKEVGIRMAVALVATLYGLIISNLVLNPLGEWLAEELKRDEVKAEMAIQSILSLKENSNVLEVQEMLNSYLDPSRRLNLVAQSLSTEQFNQ